MGAVLDTQSWPESNRPVISFLNCPNILSPVSSALPKITAVSIFVHVFYSIILMKKD